MKRIASLSLAVFTVTATACGGASNKKHAAESTFNATATPHSATASPDEENKILYHNGITDKDVTVKEFRKTFKQGPKVTTCEELLISGKFLGYTYPNGTDFFLRICHETSPKGTSTATATPHSPDDKILYHSTITGKDVTVKEFRNVMKKAPKNMNCKESLTASKELGFTFPNGEDLYLRLCTELSRK